MTARTRGGTGRSSAVRTFLIADIRGYTRFTAQHGDEAASRLAGSFAELVGEGVEAWDGQLVELRGDEALAVFDSARQALRCAVELQSAFADETAASPDMPMGVGIGIDAGEAVPVGDGYRGAALNLAARLCSVAGAGEILASQGLVHLAGVVEGLRFTPRPAAALKGLAEPVDAVLVSAAAAAAVDPDSRASATRATVDASAAPPPPLPPDLEAIVPLAGRTAELRWLRWHWRRARHGHGRSVVLSGPPGIGKTRLSAELAASAHLDGGTVRYLPSARGLDEGPPSSSGPTLRIVDDLDSAPVPLVEEVVRLAVRTARSPELLLVTHRREAAASLLPAIERVAPPERRRELGALEADAIRSIAALYAGRAVDELPMREIAEESGGVPAAVHRVAGHWARTAAARRLGEAADRTAVGRDGLRSAEAELIGNVADLELAQERSRLFATDRSDDPPGEVAAARTICPYKGLASFEAADADYFFGRERLVAELIARLVGSSFLGLIGASGSGKSSAIRAGLLPALAGGVLPGSDGWLQVVVRPGEHPLSQLSQALARTRPANAPPPGSAGRALETVLGALAPGQHLVLVIDQFEEVFGATREEAERGEFIELLTTERPGLKVVVTLRADYYGNCAAYPSLARMLAANQVLIGPLTPAELTSVVEHPAQRVGLRIEPGLTEALVADAGSEPGVLPLLSTALLELWQARDAGRLTLAAYRLSGGLRGAVARLAEAAWAELDPGQQAVTRGILLRLAGPGEGEGVVRRRVPLDELDAQRDPVVERVLDRLTAARLLTSGDGYVEVAHEALLREWPRLQAWLEEDATGRRLRLHLIGAVRDWEQRGREPGDLYRGARLAAALDWASEHRVELNAAEREFLEESRLASQRELERQRRTNSRLRGLLVGTALLLVVAIGAGALALNQAGVARDQAALAAAREQEAREAQDAALAAEAFARSRELAASAIATLVEDPSLSKLLAVAATRGTVPDREVETALHTVFTADPVVDRYAWPDARPDDELWTDLHPDGDILVAVAGNRGPHDRMEIVEWATDEVLWSFTPEPGARVGYPLFSPDGEHLVAGVFWDPLPDDQNARYDANLLGIHVWEARTGRLVKQIEIGRCGAIVQAISEISVLVQPFPEGPDAAADCFAQDPGGLLDVVRLDDGSRTPVATNAFFDRVLSRDGRYAAFSDLDDAFAGVVVDLSTSERVLRIDPTTSDQRDTFVRAISHDGSRLLYGARPIQVRDVADGSVVASLGGESGEGGEARFAADGRTVYATARDESLRQWDAESGEEIFVLPAAGGGALTATEHGIVLVANPFQRTAVVVDQRPRGEVGVVRTCPGFTAGETLTVRGDVAMMGGVCDDPEEARWPAHVIDLAGLKLVRSFENHDAQGLDMSPDGMRFIHQESGEDFVISALRIRDVRTGDLIVELEGICPWNQTVFKNDAEGCVPFPDRPFAFRNWDLEWSRDGRFLAAADGVEGFVVVWDPETGKVVHQEAALDDAAYHDLIFSPDSRRLIASTSEGAIVALSTESWEVTHRRETDPDLDGRDRLGFAGFSAGGSTLIAVGGYSGGGGGWLHRLDAETFDVLGSTEAHDGSPKTMNMSPDGSMVVTGASDGILRLWDATTGQLRHQVKFEGQVQGAVFLDDSHIAVTPHAGNLYIITIDPSELATIVAGSLTRGFTAAECERFGFADDCPTLEELRART